jgi:hypothetical protein
MVCRAAPDRRACGSLFVQAGSLAKALVSVHSTVNVAIRVALPSGRVALMSPDSTAAASIVRSRQRWRA